MTPSINGTSRGTMHPARSSKTEACLDARDLEYRFEPNYPVAQLRDAEGNQVRLSKNRTPKHTVERYTEQMRGGAIFPAIVINDAGEVVDGNTRLAAVRKLVRETIAAYVCTDLSQTVARMLSVELNQSHGVAMVPQEVQAVIVNTLRAGQNPNVASLARMTGIKPAKLRRWIKGEAARNRAAAAGLSLDSFDQLKEPMRVALGCAKLKSVFVAAIDLAIDAGLAASDVQKVVRTANAATSEAAALAVISGEREARATEIIARATGFRPAARKGADAARHLAALMNFEASDLSDVAPEKAPEAIERMERLQSEIDRALTTLRRNAPTPAEPVTAAGAA
ncbi:MAG: hypothetical protein ACLP0J_10950 [Solirubrobacteraceae bacterium]